MINKSKTSLYIAQGFTNIWRQEASYQISIMGFLSTWLLSHTIKTLMHKIIFKLYIYYANCQNVYIVLMISTFHMSEHYQSALSKKITCQNRNHDKMESLAWSQLVHTTLIIQSDWCVQYYMCYSDWSMIWSNEHIIENRNVGWMDSQSWIGSQRVRVKPQLGMDALQVLFSAIPC